ncbi:MAG: hypothetical protein ACYDH2_15625 [Anaerolineaceae bacterium]
MVDNSGVDPFVFILGAGFSVDAASEAGYPRALSSGRPAQYPLVPDLLNACFSMDTLPPNKSIEDLFQDSIDKRETQPLDNLYNVIMETDYYITPLLKRTGSHYNNAYIKFLQDFPKSPLITFNYDSLPEILLLAEQLWSPIDGYGVPVHTWQPPVRRGKQYEEKSLRPVLHLHGSLCVYPSTYYFKKQPGQDYPLMQDYDEPKFLFDPDSLGHCFEPFERIPPGVTYKRVVERVIAPIPDKAEGLKGEFIVAVYKKAVEILKTARQIVVIGYSFNKNDRSSYAELLAATVGKSVLIISPDADSLILTLTPEYPHINWEPKTMSFKDWVKENYPGIRK